MDKDNLKKTLLEFIRYSFVGGTAAVIDLAVNFAVFYYLFNADKEDRIGVALSVAAGFTVGLVVNFILSNIFVFKSPEQREKGKSAGAFLIYATVGFIGFGFTEILTIVGVSFIGKESIWYLLLNIIVKGIVLIWNYLGRKIFVYKGK